MFETLVVRQEGFHKLWNIVSFLTVSDRGSLHPVIAFLVPDLH